MGVSSSGLRFVGLVGLLFGGSWLLMFWLNAKPDRPALLIDGNHLGVVDPESRVTGQLTFENVSGGTLTLVGVQMCCTATLQSDFPIVLEDGARFETMFGAGVGRTDGRSDFQWEGVLFFQRKNEGELEGFKFEVGCRLPENSVPENSVPDSSGSAPKEKTDGEQGPSEKDAERGPADATASES